MIQLECIGHEAAYELDTICHLFEPYIQGDYKIEAIYEQAQVIIKLYKNTDFVCLKQEKIDATPCTPEGKKVLKTVLKKLVYEILSALTGTKMPWGVLTGIRPTKIVHDYEKQGLTKKQIEKILKEDYHISTEKIALMIKVAHEERKILEANQKEEISLYIGIPFCPTRCVYCSFTSYSLEKNKDQVDLYLDALCKEITFIATAKKEVPIRSLYIGGGTPTSLNEKQLERLLKHIDACFDIEKIEEYTIEAGRPDTITKEKLRIMKEMKVGRISINPQSMNQKTLDAIGRAHSVEAIQTVFTEARELGHKNINMDIILGLPGEEPADVAYTLEELAKLEPENITIHTMAIKKASVLKQTQDNYELAEVNKIHEMLNLCEEKTKQMGLKPYYMYRQKNMLGNFENVGYTKEGYACIYNIEIMEEKESIIAAGAGAITKMVYQKGERIDRIPNVKSLKDYIERIDEMIERKRIGFKKFI